jgi:endonuclease-3
VAANGTYTLLVEVGSDAAVTVGALGERTLRAGRYAYVGSAFGPGGLSRVDRHRELARGERSARHWHVDYLLGRPEATVARAVTSEGTDAECAVARAVADADGIDRVDAFGASDCDCRSHLLYAPPARTDRLTAAVERAHATARGREYGERGR